MVGGRRNRSLPRHAGHRAGVKAVRATVEGCARRGVDALTLFAFSSENWSRPADEVAKLMLMFVEAIDREVDDLCKNGIRLRFIGDETRLKPKLIARMRAAETQTAAGGRMTLNVAIAYGGRWDIVTAARTLARRCVAGEFPADAIDEAAIRSALQLGGRARSGPLHTHGWRASHQQFPAVEPGVHGALFLRRPVAGFRRRPARAGIPSLRQPAAALRAHRGASRQWLIPCVNACSPRFCSPVS